ncbi:MAG: cyanophycinase [Elusimicrobia bacterium]|nr:cyanophycinase [Elusimicrobiota bacterium]
MTAAMTAVLLLLSAAAPAQAAARRLVLFGGGDYAPSAMKRFADWSGGAAGRVLFIPWASAEPDDYIAEFQEALGKDSPPTLEIAPSTGALPARRAEFFAQLSSATAVFFCGGDQNRIAELLNRDAEIRAALHAKYQGGALFSGTSAGTAVMSEEMLTGEGDSTLLDGRQVGTDRGLGLLSDVILDQHFIERQRENRLFGIVLHRQKPLGVGIDAQSALALEDERRAEVVGPGQVMTVRAVGAHRLNIELFGYGDRFDLKETGRP